MIGDVFVIDATTHNYNLDASNLQDNMFSAGLRDLLYSFLIGWQPPENHLPEEAVYADWPTDVLAETLFLESATDMAVTHNLRLDSWFVDGLVSFEKVAEIAERWPNRFFVYLGVDPFSGLKACLEDLRLQKEAIPQAIGLKLYPDRVDPLGRWRMDDPYLAFPLFEGAEELGLRNVAIHKAIPNGPVPIEPYKVDDVDAAAITFPDLNFEIVHAGMAFLEETAMAAGRFPNVYANFEITGMYAVRYPEYFDDIMGKLLFWGGPEKILHATGALLFHPQQIVEAIWNYQLSDETLKKYRLTQLTPADKRLILGENYARCVGFDVEEGKRQLADDEFAKRLQDNGGLKPPYFHWRESAGVGQPGGVS